jgi:hypothetical protein
VVSDPFVSVPQPVKPGEQIGISIRVDSVAGVELGYEWIVPEGQGRLLEGQGTNAITYQAPVELGTYGIRVRVTTADSIIERSTFINVQGTALASEPPRPGRPPEKEVVPFGTVREIGGAEMVHVPEGSFEMGSESVYANEKPVHTVFLDAFWIDRYEVTNAQYVQFLNAIGGHLVQLGVNPSAV